jgi:hypothetical protein
MMNDYLRCHCEECATKQSQEQEIAAPFGLAMTKNAFMLVYVIPAWPEPFRKDSRRALLAGMTDNVLCIN